MSAPDFNDYRREYEAQGIGEQLYSLIMNLVQNAVSVYPPRVYSPNQVWDEDAITALCHDFIMKKLLGAGWLEYYLLSLETTTGLRRVLKRDFRHFLISQKKRSEYSNLFDRANRILRGDARFLGEQLHEKAAATIWGLGEWENKGTAQRLEEVAEAMFAVQLPPLIRYRPDSRKLSPVLSNEDLTFLLESTFEIIDKRVRFDLLMDGLRYRLGLLDADTISLDEPIREQGEYGARTYANIIPGLADTQAEVTTAQIVEDIFERLTDRQRLVLALRCSSSNTTLEQIGKQVGVSKSTVHSDLADIAECIGTFGMTEEEAEQVLEHLSNLCASHPDHTDGDRGCSTVDSPDLTWEVDTR